MNNSYIDFESKLFVVFDFDDTLLATFESRVPCLIETGAEFGYAVSEETIRALWGKPFQEMILLLFPDIDYKPFLQRYKFSMQEKPAFLKPGALDLVKYLFSRGCKISILSSSSYELIIQDLAITNVIDYIHKVWGFEDNIYTKPDPRVFSSVVVFMESCGYSVKNCVYIGDSVKDYLVAKHNDVDFLAVITGKDSGVDFANLGLPKTFIFSSLTRIFEKFQNI